MPSFDALVELVHALRARGYDLGTQECLAAHRLLLALQARGQLPEDPAQWRGLLAPVFCSTRQEQDSFTQDYAAWLRRTQALSPAPPPGNAGEAPVAGLAGAPATASATPVPPAPPWWRHAPLLVLGIAGGLALSWALYFRTLGIDLRVEAPPQARAELLSDCKTCRFEPAAAGLQRFSYRRWDLPLSITLQAPGHCTEQRSIDLPVPSELVLTLRPEPCGTDATPQPAPTSERLPTLTGRQSGAVPGTPHRGWQAGAAALPLLAGLLALLVLGWRTRLALGSAERAEPPRLKNLQLGAGTFELFDRATLRRIAQELRRHRPRATNELDAAATVAATVARAGLFTPVLRSRHALPEYLVLVNQAGARDHQARWAVELTDQLRLGGVVVDRFFFNHDPRLVQAAFDSPARIGHAELLARHHEHVLLVFGDGQGFFDPVSGEPQPWAGQFAGWPRRVLVTPLPPSRWGWREGTLRSLGWVIAPADLGGMQMVASIAEVFATPGAPQRSFPALLRDGDPRWLERQPPHEAERQRLAAQLKWYLGPAGWQWLCALALYPQLQWEVTLHIGRRMLGADDVLRGLLGSLIQLPWLRTGGMPQWLRAQLVAELSPEAEGRARAAYAELLGATGSGGFVLQVASDEASMSPGARLGAAWRRWREHAQGHDAARRSHPDSPLRDYAFVSFMRGEKPARLEMEVPKSWQRLFERGWLPSAPQALAVSLAALALGAALWWQTGQAVLQPARVEALHLDAGGGLFVRAAGQAGLWLAPDGVRAEPAATGRLAARPTPLAEAWADPANSAVVATPDGNWVARVRSNGTLLVAGPGGGSVDVIDTGLGSTAPRVLAISPDGRHVLVGSPAGQLRLVTGRQARALAPPPPAGAVQVHTLGPRHLVFGGSVLTLYTLDATLGASTPPVTLPMADGAATAVALSADGLTLAAGGADGRVRVWALDRLADQPPLVLGQAPGPVRSLAFAPGGDLLASASEGAGVQVWANDESALPLPTGPEAASPVVALAWQNDGARLAAAGSGGELWVWSLRQPQPVPAPVPVPVPDPPQPAPSAPEAVARLVVTPTTLDFGSTPLGAAAARDLTLRNSGQAAVAGLRVEAIGAGFSIDPGACRGGSLQPGARCTVRVRFTPAAEGRVTGAFVLRSSLSEQRVAAVGTGAPAEAALLARLTAEPAQISAGGSSRLCWNVSGGTARRIDPGVGELKPSAADCVTVRPAASTTYTLQARSASGAREASATAVVNVEAAVATTARPEIREAAFTPNPARPGQTVQVCYRVAQTVSRPLVEPPLRNERASNFCATGALEECRGCIAGEAPAETTRYTLIASGQGRTTATATVVLTVQAEATEGWCCAAPGLSNRANTRQQVQQQPGTGGVTADGVFAADRATCSAAAGMFFSNRALAEATCGVINSNSPCRSGFAPRGAYSGDEVCVTPATRAQAQADNAAAAQRIAPADRSFGPQTCTQGYVWREARPGDLVCVTPEVREQTLQDNRLAASRRATVNDSRDSGNLNRNVPPASPAPQRSAP